MRKRNVVWRTQAWLAAAMTAVTIGGTVVSADAVAEEGAQTAIGPKLELLSVEKVWDQSPHNAFTDLVRFQDRWYLAFREGQGHVSEDGAGRILVSDDATNWVPAARLTSNRGDVRDPKLSITPSGELMVTTAVAIQPPGDVRHQSYAWFSEDGENFSEPVAIGDENFWLWRTDWHDGAAYAIGYATTEPRQIRLYRSRDGRQFETLIERMKPSGYANESSIAFAPDGTATCLLRCDGENAPGQLGTAQPPYTDWSWKSLDRRIGGPKLIRLDDGRLLAGVRLYDGGARTSLCWIDPETGVVDECLRLPSGGDTSYPGLVVHDGVLYVSYYSSHEGRTSIYLAKVKLPAEA